MTQARRNCGRNPGRRTARKEGPTVTDRALRYRANATPPPGARICCLCGEDRAGIEIGHVDGREENSNPSNLFWTCRSCNIRCGNTLRRAGIGRLTRQYNPQGDGAQTLGQWLTAVMAMKGQSQDMSVSDAVAMIHATPPDRRSKFAKEIWRKRRQHGTDKPGAVPF